MDLSQFQKNSDPSNNDQVLEQTLSLLGMPPELPFSNASHYPIHSSNNIHTSPHGYKPSNQHLPPPSQNQPQNSSSSSSSSLSSTSYLQQIIDQSPKVVYQDIHIKEQTLKLQLEQLLEENNYSQKKIKDLENQFKESQDKKSISKINYNKKIEEWNKQCELIVKEYGGIIPEEIKSQNNSKLQFKDLKNKNETLKSCMDLIDKKLQEELKNIQTQLNNEQEIAQQTENHNLELEQKCKELRLELDALEKELEEEKQKKTVNETFLIENGITKVYLEYPPESTVIQNLLQAQVEFYFSDYNLKRDKKLLQEIVKDPKGFLPINEVMKLSKIKQLCSDKNQLIEALKRSKILTLKENEDLIGRENFEKPTEKEFPFRRTVFIFGIPPDANEDFLIDMLQPFGNISKIQFDHGLDTLDRKIGIKFLGKPRIYELFPPNSEGENRKLMIFHTKSNVEGEDQIQCYKCNKHKPCDEGFYSDIAWRELYCSQCAASLAEEQLNLYYKHKFENKRSYYLGNTPRNDELSQRKTALIVFASQRQASKCAYVRSRIAYEGAFATHYHHYSKVKKEIVTGNQNNNSNNLNDPVKSMNMLRTPVLSNATSSIDSDNLTHMTESLHRNQFQRNQNSGVGMHHQRSLPMRFNTVINNLSGNNNALRNNNRNLPPTPTHQISPLPLSIENNSNNLQETIKKPKEGEQGSKKDLREYQEQQERERYYHHNHQYHNQHHQYQNQLHHNPSSSSSSFSSSSSSQILHQDHQENVNKKPPHLIRQRSLP